MPDISDAYPTPSRRKGRRWLWAVMGVIVITVAVLVVVLLTSDSDTGDEVVIAAPSTTTSVVATTTTVPATTTTTSTSTTTTVAPTTTTTTLAPEPPASGFYIVGEEFYGDGVPVFVREIPSLLALGFPEDQVVGVADSLPEGAEIYAPFDGYLSTEVIAGFGGERSYGAGSLEQTDQFATLDETNINFTVVGDSFEFARRIEGNIEFVTESRWVKEGDLIAVVTDSSARISDFGDHNLFLLLGRFDTDRGSYVQDPELTYQFFTYLTPEEG